MNSNFFTTLVCIDSNIYSHQSLVQNVAANVKTIVFDETQNGITQITEALRAYSSILTVHIISHGAPGCLYLGNSALSLETLGCYSSTLQSWFSHNSKSPAARPQILLYGCNVAAGDAGAEFLSKLRELTQASLAASTTLVGYNASGSNWQLDYQLGHIDAENPIAADVLRNYQGVLAAPTITDTLTTIRNTPEETALTISGLSIADSDSPNQSVTLAVTNGKLLLASTAGLTVTGNNSSSITLSGAIANVNAALSGMTYTPGLDYANSETLAITTNDGTTTVSKNVAIAVTPVNDAPTIAPTAANIAEGSTGSFAAVNFGLSDVDNIAAQIIIKIAALPGKGYLTFNGSRLVVGSTLSSDQIPQLQYHHDGTQTTAVGGTSDSFQVTVDDGAGGAIAATNIPITITPVNQLPTVGGTNTLFEGQADYPVTITISDPDQTAPSYGIKVLSLPPDGILKLSGTAVSANQSLTLADLANLTYSHNGNDANNGNPPSVSFQVQVLDDGGGTGTPGSTTAAIALTIRPNNDDPILTQNNGLTLNTQTEGLTKVLTNADLQVTDPDSGTLQLTFTIKQAPDPTQGTIQRFNGATWQNLGVGTTFTQDDLDSGRIRYSFHKSTTAGQTFTDSFQFEVRDGEITEYPTVREGGIWKPDGSALDIKTFNISITTPTASGGSGGTQTLPTGGNAPPTTLNNTGFAGLLEGGTISITNAMLLTTDTDNSASAIVYRIEQAPTSGTIKVNGTAIGLYGSFTQDDINTGKVTFVHAGDEDFLDDFRFTVSDGTNILAQQIFNIDITPQNDSPTVAVNGSPNTTEAGTVNITNAHLSFADVDGTGEKSGIGYATPNALTFTVTALPSFGKLQVDQGSGYIDVATSTIITKAQLDGNKLRYMHDGTEHFADSFSVQVNDNTVETPANNLSTVKTVNIEIASLNDAPVFSSSKNLTVAEGATGTILGSNGVAGDAPRLVYTDTDNTTIQRQYRITTPPANGSVLLNGKSLSVGSVFTQDDLDNNRVTYKHDGSENYTDGFAFEVRDGSAAPVPGTYGISITPKNDPPTLAVPTTQTFSTTTPLTFNSANGNRIVIDDPDLLVVENGETDIIQVTLDFQATGATYTGSTLTLGSTTGVTITQGTSGTAGGKITIKGTKADVQAALDGLQVQVPADEDRVLSLVVTVDDLLNGDPVIAATGAVVTKTINLNTSNVNDAPTIANPASISVNEDTAFSFTGANAITITDVDTFASANNTVTVSVTQGKLTLASAGLITAGANNSGTITLTGSLAAINTALAGLSYQGNANVNGSDSLNISFNDQGNIGTGGAQIANQTVGITLVPVNDAPSLAAPSGVQTIASTGVLTFNAANSNAISIDDIIDLNPTLNATVVDNFTVTLNATNSGVSEGTLAAATGSGATITGGSGGTITITGTKAQVNAALNGLTYDPAAYNADVSLNLAVTVSDNANGGPGALTASKNITINVSDTNDPAVVTAPTSVSVNEDAVFPFSGANQITVADPDDFGNPLKVTLTVGKGTITLGTLTGLTFTTGDGTSDTTMTFQGSESAINTALQSLSYQGNSDFNSTVADTLNIQVNDLGNTGTGGAQIVNKTVNITVNPINDAPTRTAATTTLATVLEDAAPVGDTIANLFNSKFQDVKDNQTANSGSAANTLAGVAITTNAATAAQGKWQWFNGLSWNNITTAASTTSALVLSDTTLVRFLPTAEFNGTPGNLTTRLIDSSAGAVTSGSTVNVTTSGGITQYSNSSNAVTLGTTVTAVNDAPVASGSATLTAIAEDTATASITGATVTSLFTSQFSDIKDTVTGGSTANTLAGIAIVGNAATTQGTWEYFNGSSWQSVGNPSASTALIVSGADKLRFVPSLNYNGAVPALTVNLIDNSAGSVTTGTTVDLSGGGATGGTTVYSSATVPLTTTISAVNDAPTLTSLGGAVSFTENGSPVVLDGDAIAQDIELDAVTNWNGSTLTLQRQGGANTQDLFSGTGTLSTLNQGSALVVGGTTIGTVTTNTSGSLVLTFNSNATGALVTSALQQIAYGNSSDNPPATVTISYTLNDQNTGAQGTGGALTATGTVTVNITAINDPPVLDLDANNSSTVTGANYKTTFTENGSAVAIGDVDVSVTDLDNTNIASATITLTNRLDGVADVLSVVGGLPGGITASAYDSATGIITLTGSASLAAYQTAIAQIKYSNTSDNPTATDRSITVVVSDGTANSNTATTTVSVVPVNDPPVLDLDANNSTATGTSYKTTFTENGSAVAIGDIDVSVTDLDNTNIASATITLTNRLDGVADVLSVVGGLPGGITASSYNPTTGVITLTGSASLASYQTAIAQIAYSNTSDNPTATDRSITVVVNDGAANSNTATTTVSVVPVNDPPVLDLDANNSSTVTGANYKTTFTENGSAVAIGDIDVSVTDLDNTNIASATITLTNRVDGVADVLSVVGGLPGGITASAYNTATGVITLTGSASLAAYQTAIAQIAYSNTSDNPTATDRSITVVVNDGAANSNTATTTVSVVPVNDPPVLDLDANNSSTVTGANYKTTFTENGSAVAIGDIDVSVTDLDNTNIASATITLTNRVDGVADVLSVVGGLPGGITASAYNTATGVITLTGSASLAAYQTAIAQIKYSNTSDNPTATDRSITVVVSDGTANSNTATTTVSVVPVNDPPVLDLDANNSSTATGANYKTTFTENGSAVAIGDVDVSVTDLDNTNIASATITLTNRVDGVADVLSVVGGLPGGITASSYNPTTGVITLTGSASLASYQAAIAQIAYSNTSDNPTATDRTITVVVNDGIASSNTATTTVSVVPVNDPPVLDLDANNSSTATGANYKATFTENGSAVAIGDVDVSVTDLDNTNIASATITLTNRVDGVADVLSVVGGLPGGINASAYDSATGIITLTGSASLAAYQTAIAQIAYSNTSDNPTATDRTITIVVNDGAANSNTATTTILIDPNPDAVNDTVTVEEDSTSNIINVLANDIDQGNGPATITAVSTPNHGVVTIDNNGTPSDPSDDTLRYTPNPDFNGTDSFSYTITDADGDTSNATVTVNVNPVVDAIDDVLTTAESTVRSLNALNNDHFQPGAQLTGITQGINGSVLFNPNGTVTYNPNPGFVGTDSFTYTVTTIAGDTETATVNVIVNRDSDGDTIADIDDLDDDNDGIPDTIEQNGDLNRDTDGDGIVDRLDLDADNDGIMDVIEAGHTALDANQDGRVDGNPASFGTNGLLNSLETAPDNGIITYQPRNTDGDRVYDFQDLDSDNDGINDVIEAGGQDTDGNGLIDGFNIDTNGNGITDSVDNSPLPIPDTDGDGASDYRDLDSDNDGLPDLAEAGLDPVVVDKDGDGVIDASDPDGDGIQSLVDGNLDGFGDRNGPTNSALPDSDQDNIPDYRELDSDNDGIPDRIKAGLPTGANSPDADSNGKVDNPFDADNDGIADSIDVKPGVYGGFDSKDSDGDGITDIYDLDDDNDGILDTIEQSNNPERDTDGDGIVDRLDLDSDNDGILDVKEAGHTGLDINGDGRVEGPYGKNGLADSVETAPESGIPNYTPINTDGDSVPDFQDLDSDNDGISDVIEAGGKDPDGDGIIGQGKPIDTNGNGLADSVDPQSGGTPLPIPDQDGDGQPNFRDLDSDNDGIFDLVEQGLSRLDTNGDGKIDGTDSDRDGLIDTLDGNSTIFGSGTNPLPAPLDKDGNGIPDFLEPPLSSRGSQGSDNVVGTNGDDILNGFSDIDVLRGLGGNDLINGGSSRDTMYGDEGNDILNGGSNNDYMDGGTGNDRLNGGTGNDTMLGGTGNDILNGGTGNDLIRGNRGNDIINGGDGNDRLYGDQNNDIIQGNRGNDLLVGGFGKDTLTGGQGRDRFAYSSVKEFGDIITDFEIVKDRIDVKPIKGLNSIKDLKFIQQGHDTLIKTHIGKGSQLLAVLQDVRANTLTQRHFIF